MPSRCVVVTAALKSLLMMERDVTQDQRIDIAYRIFRAMCGQYPDRLLTLVDAHGRTLARSDWSDRLRFPRTPRCAFLRLSQQFRQLGNVRRYPPGLVPSEHPGRCLWSGSSSKYIGEFLPAEVFDDEAGERFFDGPWWRETALRHGDIGKRTHQELNFNSPFK